MIVCIYFVTFVLPLGRLIEDVHLVSTHTVCFALTLLFLRPFDTLYSFVCVFVGLIRVAHSCACV